MNGELDNFIPKWMQEGGIASSPISIMRLEALPAQKPASFELIDPYGIPQGNDIQLPQEGGTKYPWIGDHHDAVHHNWWAWFGAGTGSFIDPDAQPLKKFDATIGTDGDGAFFNLLIGDDAPSNDILFMSGNDHSIRASVWDYPQIEIKDTENDSGIKIWNDGTTPSILLADVYDSPSSGNTIEINIDTGPQVLLTDDTDNTIHLDLTADPLIQIYDGTGNQGTTVIDGNSLNLTDGVTGDTIIIDVSVPSFEITVVGSGDVTTLGDGDLHMSATTGSISIGVPSEDSKITLHDDCSIVLGTGADATVYSLGDIQMPADGTIEIGASGSITVGSSVLTDGDLDLGGSGTITIGTDSFSPQSLTVCVDGSQQTMQVLGTTPS